MATKAGVWIDHKQATVVLIKDAEQEIRKIAFDSGQPSRSADGSRTKKKILMTRMTGKMKTGKKRNKCTGFLFRMFEE